MGYFLFQNLGVKVGVICIICIMFEFDWYFTRGLYFFSTLPKRIFGNSKNQFFSSEMIIYRKSGIKLLMKTYLTVLLNVCKSLGAQSEWIFQNYRFSQFTICVFSASHQPIIIHRYLNFLFQLCGALLDELFL